MESVDRLLIDGCLLPFEVAINANVESMPCE